MSALCIDSLVPMCSDLFGQKFRDEGRPRTRNPNVLFRRPCDSFSISTSGSWGNLTSGKRVNGPFILYTRSDMKNGGNKNGSVGRWRTLDVYIIGSRGAHNTCDDVTRCEKFFERISKFISGKILLSAIASIGHNWLFFFSFFLFLDSSILQTDNSRTSGREINFPSFQSSDIFNFDIEFFNTDDFHWSLYRR